MSADIEKLAVFDDRIVQSRPRYAVEKGALSVTNSPFNAIAANTSQHTYNVLVPSENVFIDRSVDWTSTCFLQAQVSFTANASVLTSAAIPLVSPGLNAALCPFPLQSLTTTMTATINDTTVTINSQDVLPQVLRMTDYKKNRLIRTCPTMLDRVQNYSSALLAGNSVLAGYDQAYNVDEVPNGAFPSLAFTQQNGSALAAGYTPPGSTYSATLAGGGAGVSIPWTVSSAYGLPSLPSGSSLVSGTTYTWTIWLSFTSTEKLVLSPFVFSDIHEWDTGLFGCQNIQLVMNLQNPSRVIRSAPYGGNQYSAGAMSLYNIQYNTGSTVGAFTNSRVNLQFLTPSLDVPLPPKSVVPYMEFPRYISSNLGTFQNGFNTTQSFSSQTITLPQIPDLLIIYAKPASGYVATNPAGVTNQPDLNQGDWMFPITNISVNFDNFAGLLSAHTPQQLYKMSVHNGLEMDWPSWSGQAWSATQGTAPSSSPLLATVGSMLVLKPGRDIVLQAGQAPSLVGNFVLQFQLTLLNNTQNNPSSVQPQIYVITANSGFFETIKGSSRVIKGVLTEQDVISAPVAPGGTHGALRRAVGGSVLGSLGNALSRVKGMFSQAAPAIMAAAKGGAAPSEMGVPFVPGSMMDKIQREAARVQGRGRGKSAVDKALGALQGRLM